VVIVCASQFLVFRQRLHRGRGVPVDLTRRERRMKEEPNPHVGRVGWFDRIIRHDTLHDPLDLTESHLIKLLRTVQ